MALDLLVDFPPLQCRQLVAQRNIIVIFHRFLLSLELIADEFFSDDAIAGGALDELLLIFVQIVLHLQIGTHVRCDLPVKLVLLRR